jgi:F-type H+-transporting ATPase subunit gamma
MPSLRDLRRRIRSVTNTKKITKAMELVAAAKMRRAQERMEQSRPYADEIESVVAQLMQRTANANKHPYLAKREVHKRCLIVITTDRGSVGALNSNSMRLALREITSTETPTSIVTIGRKGRDSMRRLRRDLIAEVSGYGDRPTIADVLPAVRVALEAYEKAEVDQVDLVFAHFVRSGKQQAMLQRLLPVEPPEKPKGVVADFEYEPDPEVVLNALLPRYVEAQVYRALLENVASEQAARMVAMHNASDNANQLISDLTLTANKVRQSTITNELMEIVGGAAALEG